MNYKEACFKTGWKTQEIVEYDHEFVIINESTGSMFTRKLGVIKSLDYKDNSQHLPYFYENEITEEIWKTIYTS